MVFELKGKVALVTGGASGIGLEFVKELLRNEVKGVTLADVNSNFGQAALVELEKEFGFGKAIFVKTDVTNLQQFEDAFKKTVDTFKNIDILINNAGILDDSKWEREITINVNGVIHGMLLGLDNYLQKYKQGPEAVVLNISSNCGVQGCPNVPVYCATKFAVIGISKSWGDPYHYQRTKVRVVTICPGATNTTLMAEISGKNLGEPYEECLQSDLDEWPRQTPNHVAKEGIKVIKAGRNGSLWMIEGGETVYEYSFPEREKMERNYLNV